ncbi:unnamed protein product [Heligmosomoides polygyrus]|uniref:Helicase n=1 Tax=Heligmosomoides polygyrus TaxID=6339 RepID=A0A183G094_HELPZ|nr:unnamed protein product [Heligmosomoides polygyrus]
MVNPLEKEWEEKGLTLRDYQKEGIMTMDSWYRAGHGGINGDEMGLGKTCQAIVQMVRLHEEGEGPFLVVCPLSVCDHWQSEVERFSCGVLEPIGYFGYEDARKSILKKLNKLKKNTLFITASHIFRNDCEIIWGLQQRSKLRFNVVVVDEAHCLKNLDCQLAERMKSYRKQAWFLLMTGTPIQNNLGELYSLLTFVHPQRFHDRITSKNFFIEKYTKDKSIPELQKILAKYMVRRTKDEVCKELPTCEQVILYHNISEMQKKLYLDIIASDYVIMGGIFRKELSNALSCQRFLIVVDINVQFSESIFATTNNNNQSLVNLHMQLRKCVAHPYLFRGMEPEPFEEGEHLVEASGKFMVSPSRFILDRLLKYLKERHHRCLIFSQFVIVLDIVQDFMDLRDYNYERVDGSVRAEERYAAIDKYQRAAKRRHDKTSEEEDPWCFLLTTKTGGVGLNLTGADTVIFLDADWNPQNDIQAMARCHRIGQDRPVRAVSLLSFTEVKLSAFDMLAMVKESLGTLTEQKHEKYILTDKELESVIGETDEDNNWLPLKDEKENEVPLALRLDPDEVDKRDTDYNDYRVFEGRQYRISAKDEQALEQLRLLHLERKTRSNKPLDCCGSDDEDDEQTLKEKKEKQQRDHMEAAEKRKKAVAEKTAATWKAHGYESKNLPMPSPDGQDEEVGEVEEGAGLFYVHGDVTRPQRSDDDTTVRSLILHLVDNSGKFGNGGVFSALRAKDPAVGERYELIHRMRDMKLGDCHLVENVKELRGAASGDDNDMQPSTSTDSHEHVVLFVAQSSKHRDVIRPALLEQCFSRIGQYARHNNASVHMARIGYENSPSVSPRVSKKRKITHAKDDFVVDEEEDDDEETDESSDASSSASEHDWSEAEEEEDSSEEDDDIGPSSEEVDDEELEELRIKRIARRRSQCLSVRKRRNSSAESRSSADSHPPPSTTFHAAEDASDSDGYCTPEHSAVFADVAVSLYGVEKQSVTALTDIINSNDGYVVPDDELQDATHAIVPVKTLLNSQQLKEYRALFSEGCVFVKEDWISDSIRAGKRLDTESYEVLM